MEAKNRFKAIRDHYNLSMGAFGEKIGLSASGVSAIEYGTRSLSEKHIKLIHAAFPEINEDWLRTGNGDMLSNKSSSFMDELSAKFNLSTLERDIIQAFLDMEPDQQKVFLEMARALKK